MLLLVDGMELLKGLVETAPVATMLVVVPGAMVALAVTATALALMAERFVFPHHPH